MSHLSKKTKKRVAEFARIQHSPVRERYLISYKTGAEIYAKAYKTVRMEDKND
jgi:hypothetical protein